MPKTETTTKKPATSGATTSLVLGIISIATMVIPFVGFTIGLIGLIFSLLEFKKKGTTKEGYQFVAYIPWSVASGQAKAGFITSLIGVFGPFLFLFIIGAITKLT